MKLLWIGVGGTRSGYTITEGNKDSHVKTSIKITGASDEVTKGNPSPECKKRHHDQHLKARYITRT